MLSVLQDWMGEIPIRMQSTLLLSLRGPDTHRCPEIKAVQRWMRGLVFRPGNPANVAEFMTSSSNLPNLDEKGKLARELEFCTQHFYSHLMHGLQVLGYCHPSGSVKQDAIYLYDKMCDQFHLPHESASVFSLRLGQIRWPGGVQPETFEKALGMVHVAESEEEAILRAEREKASKPKEEKRCL